MAKAKVIEAPVELPLEDRIMAIRNECDRLIDAMTAEKKASKDASTLPVGVIRHIITGGESCQCRCVLRLLSEKNQ